MEQFLKFFTHDMKLLNGKFKSFDRGDIIACILFSTNRTKKVHGARCLLKNILTLSHIQVAVDPSFSISKSLLNPTLCQRN